MRADDGTNAHLHADGALPELDGAGQPTYFLGETLGCVRGLLGARGNRCLLDGCHRLAKAILSTIARASPTTCCPLVTLWPFLSVYSG